MKLQRARCVVNEWISIQRWSSIPSGRATSMHTLSIVLHCILYNCIFAYSPLYISAHFTLYLLIHHNTSQHALICTFSKLYPSLVCIYFACSDSLMERICGQSIVRRNLEWKEEATSLHGFMHQCSL